MNPHLDDATIAELRDPDSVTESLGAAHDVAVAALADERHHAGPPFPFTPQH